MRQVTTPQGNETLAAMRAAQAEGYTLFPVWREVLADCETPVSAFRKLARGPYTFLLESVEGGERMARYSFVGIAPERVLRVRGQTAEWRTVRGDQVEIGESIPCGDPLRLIEEVLGHDRVAPVTVPATPGASVPRFIGGAVGYLGYETVARFERVPLPDRDSLGLPDAVLIFSDTLLIFDHVAHRARLLTHARLEGDLEIALDDAEARLDAIEHGLDSRPATGLAHHADIEPVQVNEHDRADQAAFEEGVHQCKEAIMAGDAFQIVLSRRIAHPTSADAFAIYRALRALNPSPYL
ncbi:MAG TPA: chorismate-binding protein, partial [Ktedonobacterales bacterium]|nr:chorismate-binding protein [Ktedonobacterales bacterium]